MQHLDDRMKSLEERIELLEKSHSLTATRVSVSPATKIDEKQVFGLKTPSLSLLSQWILENWMMILGVLMMVLAGGWFVGHAFSNDLIGPEGRIFFCIVCAALMYTAGVALMKRNSRGAQALILLGTSFALMSLYVAHRNYNLLSPSSTFFIMFLALVPTAFLALKRDLVGLGFTTIATALIIPMFIDLHPSMTLFVMGYLLLIDVAALVMFLVRGWGSALKVAGGVTLFYALVLQWGASLSIFSSYAFYLTFFIPSALSACDKSWQRLPIPKTPKPRLLDLIN